MNDRIEKLLAWQTLEERLFNLHRTILSIPEEAERAKDQLAAHQASADAAKKATMDAEKRIKTIQLDIDSIQTKIGDSLRKSNDLRDNDLYRAVMQSVEDLKEKISGLETVELEEMERLDACKLAQRQAAEALATAQKRVTTEIQDLQARAGNCKEEVVKVTAARDQAATEVDPDTLRFAQRLIAMSVPGKRFRPALTAIHNGNCGACHMKVTSNTVNSAKKGSGICDTCGSMVYHESPGHG